VRFHNQCVASQGTPNKDELACRLAGQCFDLLEKRCPEHMKIPHDRMEAPPARKRGK
jgi:hypothetical protein